MNRICHPVQNLSDSIGHALHKGFSSFQCLVLDTEQSEKEGKNIYIEALRRPIIQEIEVVSMFLQTLDTLSINEKETKEISTTFYAIILGCSQTNEVCVYFGSNYGYTISNPNEKFSEDVSNRQLLSRNECTLYESE